MRLFRISAAAGAVAVATALTLAAPAQAATITATDWAALDAAFDGAADGDVVILGADIVATGTAEYLSVPTGRGVTLDLNGHSLTVSPNAGPGIHVGETSTLTIDDTVGTGRLNATGAPDLLSFLFYPGIGTDNTDNLAGTVVIRGGAITANGSQFAAGIGGARFKGGGPVIMTGGKLTAIGGSNASSVGSGQFVSGQMFEGSITVEGPEDAAGLPSEAATGSPDTEPSPISYTTPTPGITVTGNNENILPEIGILSLAFHYRVTFAFADGSTPDSTQVVDWGAQAQIPATPVRAGYTFAGWAPTTPGTTPEDAVKQPMVFTAQWTPSVITPTEAPTMPPTSGPVVHTGGSVSPSVDAVRGPGTSKAGLAVTGGNTPWLPFGIGVLLAIAGGVGLFLHRPEKAS